MASLCCKYQVRYSCSTNANYGRSCSKAQACLTKILHLISTIPPPCESAPNPFEKRGFDIDLNLRLASFLDDESEEKSESLAENSFVGKSLDGGEEEIQEKTATDVSSDVTEMQKSEVKTAITGFTDSLDLLIEAAKVISGRGYSVNEEETDGSPVVRSKRGRFQVLPRRFRDSVMEPWKKRPQRSAAIVKKRRSR
ncbi:putative HhH-GPD base excision DNA repair family protein [Hibiscus syriacus]|uniref:HhH-GPD base excision DNA repair family protein n=1 Tax=Hibiscus syriacus TaxID=106335 RepID=A0A6A3CTP0_HIBSY|nr:putative HhH-GPD base excision DNA repair family protein [Hibiscus syriacus]